jgi:hypothetical protein
LRRNVRALAGQSGLNRLRESIEPSRIEQIGIGIAPEWFRHITIIKPYWDSMNRTPWELFPRIQRHFHFALDIAASGHRGARKEDQNKVGIFECPRDFLRPFLPRQEVFFIQPRLESFDSPKAVIDLTNLSFILVGMAKKNPRHNAFSLSGFIAAFYRVLSAGHIE